MWWQQVITAKKNAGRKYKAFETDEVNVFHIVS